MMSAEEVEGETADVAQRDAEGRFDSPPVLAPCAMAAAGLAIFAGMQSDSAAAFGETLAHYLLSPEIGPFVVWSAAYGLVAAVRRRAALPVSTSSVRVACMPSRRARFAAFFTCGCVAVAVSAAFGWPHRGLPPLFHDEHAYLFQAKTFLLGRLANPELSGDLAAFLDQPHLLTSPVYASRYFPGTAFWLLPWVHFGVDHAANWMAGGLAAGFVASAGCHWGCRVGWIAGLAASFAPAMAAWSNLRLSCMPMILAMSMFLDAYLATIRTGSRKSATVAGWAMAMAFLTRPLTAVGLGFPFAVHAVWRFFTDRKSPAGSWTPAMAAAFACGPILLAGYNLALTGQPFRSPYGLYMATRTPCHQYGFYNKSRGLTQRSPTVFIAYDEWSEELTPAKAPAIVARRWRGTLNWWIGLAPGALLLAAAVLRLRGADTAMRLVVFGILGLTVAYAPYWFEGLLGHSYLTEAGPWLLLWFAWATLGGRRGRRVFWWGVWVLAAFLNLAHQTPAALSPGSELVQPRLAAAEYEGALTAAARSADPVGILALVDADPAKSLHSTPVHNDPALRGKVVRAWNLERDRSELYHRFPGRKVVIIRPAEAGTPTSMRWAGETAGVR